MTRRRRGGWAMGIFLLVAAGTAVSAVVVAARRGAPNAVAAAPAVISAVPVPAETPIAAEADVFRTTASVLAISPSTDARRSAHPRTLATFRALRAYPGAPPRIPHGLTPKEFQTGDCNACHARGGYSQRFGAYVPITPHADMGACLQCHVGDAMLMAIPLPSTDPSARCRQCHTPGQERRFEATVDWQPMAWPSTARATPGAPPPAIPHTLQDRGNCVACHAAPAGVEEIRTRHPERSNCRQCHLQADADAGTWRRGEANRADAVGTP
ncbi:MAG TPA: hypothetical protein VK922_02405 [Gemmatimonadaceae bacterium]|nr:hypothetical protein [Gemmatimonadaceae bacterium]